MSLRPGSTGTLWALLAVQGFCTVFFVFDAVTDFLGLEEVTGPRGTQVFEYLMAAALLAGCVLTAICLRAVSQRHARLREQVAVASGAFEKVLQAHFAAWHLTTSERDVARLSIKGLSVAEMAHLRGSAEGTVKAHCAAVYRKAGVSGRLQLISLFIEELMAEPVLPDGAGVRDS